MLPKVNITSKQKLVFFCFQKTAVFIKNLANILMFICFSTFDNPINSQSIKSSPTIFFYFPVTSQQERKHHIATFLSYRVKNPINSQLATCMPRKSQNTEIINNTLSDIWRLLLLRHMSSFQSCNMMQ